MSTLRKRAGFSTINSAALTTSPAIFACTEDIANSPESANFPANCNIQTVEIYLEGIDGSGYTVQMYLARDSAGLVPITPKGTSGSTQNISYTDGTAKGGVVFQINTDFNFDSGVTNSTRGTVYVVAKISSGNASGQIRVNWRA